MPAYDSWMTEAYYTPTFLEGRMTMAEAIATSEATESQESVLDRMERRKAELAEAYRVEAERRDRQARKEARRRDAEYIGILWRDVCGESRPEDVQLLMAFGIRPDVISKHLDGLRLLKQFRDYEAETEHYRALRNRALEDFKLAQERAEQIVRQARDVRDKLEHQLGMRLAAPSNKQSLMFSPGSPIKQYFCGRGDRLICENDESEPSGQGGSE
jgi:hypothetical protein